MPELSEPRKPPGWKSPKNREKLHNSPPRSNARRRGKMTEKFTGPWTFARICCPQLPHHRRKNGTHSTCFYSTGGHAPKTPGCHNGPKFLATCFEVLETSFQAKICTNFPKRCTNFPKLCTKSLKTCTNFPKRFQKNIVTRFLDNFRIYGSPPSPGQEDVNGEKLTVKKWWIFGAGFFTVWCRFFSRFTPIFHGL